MSCADFEKFVSAFVDGELDAPTMRDFELHRSGCERCRALCESEHAVKRAVRSGLRGVTAPVELRERIRSSLDRADAEVPVRLGSAARWLVPLGAAAVLLFYFYGRPLVPRQTQSAGILQDLTGIHAKNLPVEVASADPNQVAGWFQGKVDFRVRLPRFQAHRIQLIGARLGHVGNRQAAQLVYLVDGRRVTVLVYETDRPIDEGQVKHVRGHDVRVWHARGYSSAAVQRGDLGYVVVSDLDPVETVRLASHARW